MHRAAAIVTCFPLDPRQSLPAHLRLYRALSMPAPPLPQLRCIACGLGHSHHVPPQAIAAGAWVACLSRRLGGTFCRAGSCCTRAQPACRGTLNLTCSADPSSTCSAADPSSPSAIAGAAGAESRVARGKARVHVAFPAVHVLPACWVVRHRRVCAVHLGRHLLRRLCGVYHRVSPVWVGVRASHHLSHGQLFQWQDGVERKTAHARLALAVSQLASYTSPQAPLRHLPS